MFIILTFLLLGATLSFGLSFPITSFLYKYKLVRSGEFDDTYKQFPSRQGKKYKPLMGGIIVILTVLIINLVFNLKRSNTLIPLSVLLLCAIIGALDDFLNIYGRKRPVKKLRHTIKLALHHAEPMKRVYFTILLPWTAYKTFFYSFSSRLGTGLHPHEKVLVQTIAGSIIAYWLYFKIHWTLLWLPWFSGGIFIHIGVFLIPLAIFLVVFMENSVNITDGMDGLSAGVLMSCYAVFMIIAFRLHNTPIALLCATTVGALIAYLYFNIKPARFEMGDVGSLALGAMLATIAILLHREVLLLICGAVFIIEIGSVILQKIYKLLFHKKLFSITPIHHHFEMIGWSEEKIVMRAWLLSLIFAVITLWISLV